MSIEDLRKPSHSTIALENPAGKATQEWVLLNPAGTVAIRKAKPARRPDTLRGKRVVLRWNLKHNGNHYLDRIAELLPEKVAGATIIKLYEIDESTNKVSGSHQESERIARIIAETKADLVIGAQGD